MTAKQLQDHILQHGGATLKDGAPVTHSTGYQVALGTTYYKDFIDLLTAQELLTNYPNAGVWFNKKTEEYEIDLYTVHILSIHDAKIIGRTNNQKAIFDWNTFETIYLEA